MALAIEFKGVNKWFGQHHVLVDVDLSVEAGEVIVVCGPSGSGKSTLIRCVNRLEPTQKGDIRVLGQSITAPGGVNLVKLRTEVGMVFQSFNLFPHMTALQNIMLAPRKVKGLPAGRGGEDRARSARAGAHPRAGRLLPGQSLGRPAAAGGHRPRPGHAAARSCCSTSPPRRSTPR